MPIKNKNSHPSRPVRLVQDIVDKAKTVPNDASVKEALAEMKTRQTNSSLVTNRRGELQGTVSTNEMNRTVGGRGHDPQTEPIKGQVEPVKAECFEDQTLAEAEHLMHEARVTEIAVVSRGKFLVGTTNLEAIAIKKTVS